jgi:heat shock protein HtpX
MAGIYNQFKTVVFLALLTALLLFVGNFFGTSGLIIAFIFAIIINLGSYWFSDKIVLWMYRARELNPKDHSEVRELVRDVSHRAKLPMPRLYIIDSLQPNAFATGRSEHHAAVAFTTGILSLLSKDELRGVIAHELSHIKNKDILITTIAATIAGVISYLASMAQWAMIFSGFGGSRDNDSGKNLVGLLILAILTPILATLLQLALSRSREYLADETGAATLKDGKALASALEKLEKGVSKHRLAHSDPATASLFICNPLNAKGLISLFSTHPPISKRVERLQKMKF